MHVNVHRCTAARVERRLTVSRVPKPSSHGLRTSCLQPVRIARIHCPRFVPRVGLPRNLFLIGSLTAAVRCSKGWVRQDANLGLRSGCARRQGQGTRGNGLPFQRALLRATPTRPTAKQLQVIVLNKHMILLTHNMVILILVYQTDIIIIV